MAAMTKKDWLDFRAWEVEALNATRESSANWEPLGYVILAGAALVIAIGIVAFFTTN